MTSSAGVGMRAGRDASPVRRSRALVVAAGGAAALVAWTLIEPVLGVELRAPAFGGAESTSDIGPRQVLITSVIAGLAGWAILELLERLTARAARIWAAIAIVALLLSLGGPLLGSGVSGGNRLGLVALHLVVAAVLIPALYRSAGSRTRATSA